MEHAAGAGSMHPDRAVDAFRTLHLEANPMTEGAPPSSELFDLVVIGGGVMGMFTAWTAAQHGSRVAVLERGRLGDPATVHPGMVPAAEVGDPVAAALSVDPGVPLGDGVVVEHDVGLGAAADDRGLAAQLQDPPLGVRVGHAKHRHHGALAGHPDQAPSGAGEPCPSPQPWSSRAPPSWAANPRWAKSFFATPPLRPSPGHTLCDLVEVLTRLRCG